MWIFYKILSEHSPLYSIKPYTDLTKNKKVTIIDKQYIEFAYQSEVKMTVSTSVKVSKRNQIAVPAIARQLLNIKSGDRLVVDIQDGIMILLPEPENYTEAMAGLHKELWEGDDAQKYISEERDAWANSPKD
jgi:AbrB family looped-hinge helix DNA binding protein